MARAFTLILLSMAVFCIGQWCAAEGYTVKKALNWAQVQMSSENNSRWLDSAGLGQFSYLFKKSDATRAPRAIPGSVAKSPPYKPSSVSSSIKIPFNAAIDTRTSSPVANSALNPAPNPVLAKPIPQIDEEGLSPTDREALIGLLK